MAFSQPSCASAGHTSRSRICRRDERKRGLAVISSRRLIVVNSAYTQNPLAGETGILRQQSGGPLQHLAGTTALVADYP